MKLTDRLLKKLVMEQINEDQPAKAGTATAAGVEGNVDLSKIAQTLGVDLTLLKAAVTGARQKVPQRKTTWDKVLADVFIKLMAGSDQDVVTVMTILKKFKNENE